MAKRVQSVHIGQTNTGYVVKRISGSTKKPYNIRVLDRKTTKYKSTARKIAKYLRNKIKN